jgi:hypothetical protein
MLYNSGLTPIYFFIIFFGGNAIIKLNFIKFAPTLSCGVMVARQILVLFVWVRVLAGQLLKIKSPSESYFEGLFYCWREGIGFSVMYKDLFIIYLDLYWFTIFILFPGMLSSVTNTL